MHLPDHGRKVYCSLGEKTIMTGIEFDASWGEKVGTESRRTWFTKFRNGFFKKYMGMYSDAGGRECVSMWTKGLELGFKGYTTEKINPILPSAIGIDTDFPCYDGKTLPFPMESQDYVYSSHCLEHIENPYQAIEEWHRVTKIGGFVIIVVPHQFLYEKKESLPSKWNGSHHRFYTPSSLLNEVEQTLIPNSYRVRFLEDGDEGFTYDIGPDHHSGGQYEITLVIEKIKPPQWKLSP